MLARILESISRKITDWTGSSWAFTLALLITIVWLVSGPVFHYSDAWQLVINTITNVVTFIMVFVIQRSQNKDTLAVNLKLNELVAAVKGASNRLISAESLSEEELKALRDHYDLLLKTPHVGAKSKESVSIEDAA